MGVAQAPFIGFSLGGRIAVELVAAERFRVERLVLMEPALQTDPRRAAANAEALLTDTSFSSTEEAIQARIASGFAPYAPREHWDSWSEQLATGPDGRLRLPFSRAAAIALHGELTTPPPPFDRLRLPTLLILGAESDLITPKQLERYTYDLGDYLEVRTVKAKHQLIGDAADEVAAAIARFLAR